jgi:hypothetical protein
MRRALTALLATGAAGAALFVVLLLTQGTELAFTLGVPDSAPVATLKPGQSACQRTIAAQGDGGFDRLRFTPGTFGRRGPELVAGVRLPDGRPLAHGVLRAGYPDITGQHGQTIRLSRHVDARRFAVCFTNRGDRKVALYGTSDAATASTAVTGDGQKLNADIDIAFERAHRSWASQVGDVADRATLFRWPHPPSWLYVALLCAFGAGAFAALAAALATALRGATGAPEEDAGIDSRR